MFGALWKRIFGKTNAPEQEPALPPYDPLAALRDQVWRDVAGGFHDDDAILTAAHDTFVEELPGPTLRREASAALRQALAEHNAAEKAWPDMTDCDRLDAAFAALEAGGVIARQNFTCCGSCGAIEIWDEIEEAIGEGRPAEGYAFFHMQDTEAAVEGEALYLNYGACAAGEAAALDIGRRIAAQLDAHDLAVDWDGSWSMRIQVVLDWKKRRTLRMLEA